MGNRKLMTRRRRTIGNVNEGLAVFHDDHHIYGMFYSAFRKETWWWEGTVAMRKIVIAMIGVFGAELENMQVHLTIMMVVSIMLITAQVRPFGGLKHGMLHKLEMASLMATFLTLWAGSVFNTLPRCEDPLKGEGNTILWCDLLSIVVGMVDIAVVVAFVVCFIYLKVVSITEGEETINPEVAAITTAHQNNTTSDLENEFDISVNPMMLQASPKKDIKMKTVAKRLMKNNAVRNKKQAGEIEMKSMTSKESITKMKIKKKKMKMKRKELEKVAVEVEDTTIAVRDEDDGDKDDV